MIKQVLLAAIASVIIKPSPLQLFPRPAFQNLVITSFKSWYRNFQLGDRGDRVSRGCDNIIGWRRCNFPIQLMKTTALTGVAGNISSCSTPISNASLSQS